MAVFAATIDGVPYELDYGSLRIQETINGRDRLQAQLLSEDGSDRPDVDDEVVLTRNGTAIFGGHVSAPAEQGFGSAPIAPISLALDGESYSALPRRRLVTLSIAAGTTKAALTALVPFLTGYGVSLDPAQVDGPALPALVYDRRNLEDVLNELAILTIQPPTFPAGLNWEITAAKLLRMVAPASAAAPFNVATGDGLTVGDITVERNATDRATKVYVFFGQGTQPTSQNFVANGVATSFQTTYRSTKNINDVWPNVLIYNGVVQGPVGWGVTPGIWYWNFDTHTLVNDTGVVTPNGTVITVPYTLQFPLEASADSGAPAAQLRERAFEYPDVFDPLVAQGVANGLLERFKNVLHTIRYQTFEHGVHPGQTQTIAVPERGINGTCLITDVTARDHAGDLLYTVTAVTGALNPEFWGDTYKLWAGGGTSSSAPIIINSGGGSSATPGTSPIPLGGSRELSVAPASGVWVPVPSYLAHVPAATFNGRVRAEIWARNAGVTVRARLRNVTDSTDVQSNLVTSQTPTEVFIPPTGSTSLVAGKRYRLEVQNSASGEGAFAIGVLEVI